MLNKILIVILFNVCLTYGQTDRTLEDRATGNEVVDAVIQKIKDSGIFADDKRIMKRTAFVESRFGTHRDTFRDGYYGGIWQIDAGAQGAFTEITKHADRHATLNRVIIPAIKDKFGIDIKNVKYEDLVKPLYSGLFARMRYYIVPAPIPDESDIKGQGQYWKKYYNSAEGAGHSDKFEKKANIMERLYPGGGDSDGGASGGSGLGGGGGGVDGSVGLPLKRCQFLDLKNLLFIVRKCGNCLDWGSCKCLCPD